MSKSHKLLKDQTGMVSILFTMITMLIISLIVIGFARIIRREQRQSLDHQLSTQAFYAAESGVNDAVQALKAGYGGDKNNCEWGNTLDPPLVAPITASSNIVDSVNGVSYTCLLIDQSPPSLIYDNIDTGRSTVIPIKPKNSGDTVSTITISWQDKDGGTNASGCPPTGEFRSVGQWEADGPCDAGIMRIDLVPSSGGLSRAGLVSSTFTAFAHPRAGGVGSIGYASGTGYGSQGVITEGNCTVGVGERFCNITITGLSANTYHMRLKSIYKAAAATITATTPTGPTELIGTQAVVDSTGKASDILRRIQVRVPINRQNEYLVDFPLESVDTICKRMKVAPDTVPDFDNPICRP